MFPNFEPNDDNHHYVPQFLLKNFAIAGSDKAIAMVLLKENRYVPVTAIEKMASELGFYRYTEYEAHLAEIEGRAQKILDRIATNRELPVPKSQDHQELLQFILLQRSRTAAALSQRNSLIGKMVEREIAGNPEIAASLPITIDQSGSLSIFQCITEQVDLMPIILDLKMILLIRGEPFPFIISDNPVVAYNQYCYYVQKEYCDTGLSMKGLQLFMPITPDVCIMLYDGFAYKVGDGASQVALNESDTHKVNLLQAANALACIYANDSIPPLMLKHYAEKNAGYYAQGGAQLKDVEVRSQAGVEQMIEASLAPNVTEIVFEAVAFHPDCWLYFMIGGHRPNELIPLFMKYLHARYHEGWERKGFADWYEKNPDRR